MLQEIAANNWSDENGNPAGGKVHATGLHIQWQRGPLGRGDARKPPNGCFVETVIVAAKQRLEWYQSANDGKFACVENAAAIKCLGDALAALNERTERRERAGLEGTHTPDHPPDAPRANE